MSECSKSSTPSYRTMGWTEPDSWATKLFSGDPLIILLSFVVAVTLPLLLHLYFYTTSARSVLTPAFLLLGTSASGKTSLISLLQKRSTLTDTSEPLATRISQIPSNVTLDLPPSISLGSNKYRSENDTSLKDVAKNPAKYQMIDTPGHGKLRLEQALSHLSNPAVRGVIFVVDSGVLDSNDSSALRDTAVYLHNTLLALQRIRTGKGVSKAKHDIPVLVAANKQDLFTALPAGAVRDRLQTEIEKVRISKSKGLSTVGQEEVDEDDILGGGGEDKFTFDLMQNEYGIAIDVIGGAIKGEKAGKGVRKWEEWIGSNM